MATQPHRLRYLRRWPDGSSVYVSYTPDVALRSTDGRLSVIEIKPFAKADTPWWRLKAEAIRTAYAEHGVTFQTWTERNFKVEPRHTNVAMMLQNRRTTPDDEADAVVRAAILHVGLPTTIGAIGSLCRLSAAHDNVDRAFTAVVCMALDGEVSLNLGVPLGPDTIVRAGVRSQGASR